MISTICVVVPAPTTSALSTTRIAIGFQSRDEFPIEDLTSAGPQNLQEEDRGKGGAGKFFDGMPFVLLGSSSSLNLDLDRRVIDGGPSR